jgi:hypothetical protein
MGREKIIVDAAFIDLSKMDPAVPKPQFAWNRSAMKTVTHHPTRPARSTAPVRSALAALFWAVAFAAAAAPAPPADGLRGEVLETRSVDGYTYLRLKTAGGETWAAVPTSTVKPGAQVTLGNTMVMENFESKTLKKKFDKIVFGQIVDPAAGPGAGNAAVPAAPPAKPIKVDKASGPDARTVAEVVTGKTGLKDKSVQLRGQVVKVNTGIMGKNWLHLRDGSGSAADGSNDILVTTKDIAALGDVVSVKGTVRTDVNLGSGYTYAVLIEDATVRK